MESEKTQEVIKAVVALKETVDETIRLKEERDRLDDLLNKEMVNAQGHRDRVSVLLTVGRNIPERSIQIPGSSECVTARLDLQGGLVQYRVLGPDGVLHSWTVKTQ